MGYNVRNNIGNVIIEQCNTLKFDVGKGYKKNQDNWRSVSMEYYVIL